MQVDFHVHTNFSDGTLTPEEILKACADKKLDAVGICDHWGTSKYSDKFQVTEIGKYVSRLKSLRAGYAGMEVHIGLEVDFSNKYGVDVRQYDYNELNTVDYILFEHVNTDEVEGNPVDGRSLDELIAIRNNFSIPVGLAHNHFQKNFDGHEEETIQKLSRHNIFLELCEAEDKGKKVVDKMLLQQMMEIKKNFNSAFEVGELLSRMKGDNSGNAVRKKHAEDNKYFFEHFSENTWELIKKYKLPVSISSDSHKGLEIGKCNTLMPYLQKYDLERQIIFQRNG